MNETRIGGDRSGGLTHSIPGSNSFSTQGRRKNSAASCGGPISRDYYIHKGAAHSGYLGRFHSYYGVEGAGGFRPSKWACILTPAERIVDFFTPSQSVFTQFAVCPYAGTQQVCSLRLLRR